MPMYQVKLRRYFHASEVGYVLLNADGAAEAERAALEGDPNDPEIEWEVDYGDYEHAPDFDVVEITKEDWPPMYRLTWSPHARQSYTPWVEQFDTEQDAQAFIDRLVDKYGREAMWFDLKEEKEAS